MNKSHILLVAICLWILSELVSPQHLPYEEEFKNPCRLAKQRKLPKNQPVIRVIDEATGVSPDVLLGEGGIRYYMLPPNTPTDVVIECSSSLGRVEWFYRGRGASSGFKVINTRWSASSPDLKSSCHSAALVISNITDQLTGEYTCRSASRSRSSKENLFLLFVPQPSPFYHKEGKTVNISVPTWTTEVSEQVNLPCISKTRTGAGISLHLLNYEGDLVKLETGRNLTFNPFVGFQLIPTKELFGNTSVAKFQCKFDKDLQGHVNLANTTLLHINLILQSDEKFAPEKPLVKSSSPYFSWTTKQSPQLLLTPDLKSNTILWQQYFTKNDYEEYSAKSPAFHLGSLHLVNLTEGAEGEVVLYDGTKSAEDSLIYKWKYNVLDKGAEDVASLLYEVVEGMHVFTCISATENEPNATFTQLFSDEEEFLIDFFGLNRTEPNNGLFKTMKCPKAATGCVILTTAIPQGEVTCTGDGVDRSIRYPINSHEPNRPFFVERGETIRVVADDIIVTLPCLPNVPEAQYSVHLYKKIDEGYKKLWSGEAPAKSSEAVEFYPNWGFHLDTSYDELKDPTGEYICTSSVDLEDRSDAIKVIVVKEPEIQFKAVPKDSKVYGVIPFTLRWESEEEIEILEDIYKNVTIEPTTERSELSYRGRLVLQEEMDVGEVRNVTLLRKSDKSVLHSWRFHRISSEAEEVSGLIVDTDVHENGDHTISLTCRSKSMNVPHLNYHFCQSPNSCDLMKRCAEKECNPDHRFEEILDVDSNGSSNCSDKEGCAKIKLKSIPLNGFLKVACIGDGVKEHKTISDVFFREDIHWTTSKDQDLIYLYVNMPTSTDQNPQREIRSIGSNLDWEIGDTVVFSCAAAPFLFSNGIKWAIETKDGVIIYQKDNIFDPQFKYSGPTQVLSSYTMLIDSYEIKRIWCFVPTLSSPVKWRNISQPIFIRPEVDENCHETEPSIRLLNMYPPPSKLDFNIDDPRLDKKTYFELPEGVKQFAVKITGPEPVDWLFTAFGAGPSMTPLIQSDRLMTNFYDASSYCYTSRLLVNLRHKNNNDTGRYVAKFKYHPETFLSFYLFVPSNKAPYLLRSGLEVNETLFNPDRPFYLPCLVNNPNVIVGIFKKNVSSGDFEKFENKGFISYDPTLGYIFRPKNNNTGTDEQEDNILGTYKCVADGNADDFIIINVVPKPDKTGELKYEKVGEIHIFTCLSSSNKPPSLNFTDVTFQVEGNLSDSKTKPFTYKECPDGCLILMTTAPRGVVHCVGDGIDEQYRYPTISDGNARNTDRKTGLWFDTVTNAFKCQTNAILPPKLAAVTCRRPNECEIMQNLLRGEGDTSQSTYSECGEGCAQLVVNTKLRPTWQANWFSIFVRCKGDDNMEIFSQYFQDKNDTVLTMDAVEKYRKIRLDVISFRREKNLVSAKFRCYANRYFFSRGFQWALEKRNGAMVFQDDLGRELEVQSFGSTMSEVMVDFDESKYKAVWCFVPMLDSPKWFNSTVSFPVDLLINNL